MRKPNRFSSGETSMKRTPWFTLILALLAVATLSVPVAAAQTGTVPLLGGIRDGSVYLFGAAGTEPVQVFQRSEEHTSELQSRENLVCRLLLEKKKKNNTAHPRRGN